MKCAVDIRFKDASHLCLNKDFFLLLVLCVVLVNIVKQFQLALLALNGKMSKDNEFFISIESLGKV